MLLLVFGLASGVLFKPNTQLPKPLAEWQFKNFTQRLDHFSSDTRTWNQRYGIWYDTLRTNYPVFLFLGGEAPLDLFLSRRQMNNWAARFQGMLYAIEHRFYGQSSPLPEHSTANFKYLTADQALADANDFLQQFKGHPIVVLGCSYSGALAAWFEQKYPDVPVFTYAPSSPLQAVTDFEGFYRQFSTSANPYCVRRVQSASAVITNYLTTTTGRASLSKIFNTCEPLTPENSEFFKYCVVGLLGALDQTDNPPDFPLEKACDRLAKLSDPLRTWADIYAEQGGGQLGGCYGFNGCNSFNDSEFIASLKQTSPRAEQAMSRSWYWQSCLEFGYFATSRNGSSPFPDVSLDLQLDWCSRIFGIPGFIPDTVGTNAKYGGQKGYHGRARFTNGMRDPWHLLSINDQRSYSYDAGHCAVMHEHDDLDPPSLVEARDQIGNDIEAALNQFYSTR